MPAHVQLTGQETLVDLSHPLTRQMMPYPGDPPLSFQQLTDHDKDGFLLHEISGTAHTGTHMDAPAHFHKTGDQMDQHPASYWMGEALVLDARDQTVIDLKLPDQLIPGAIDFLLIRTDWDQYYNTSEYFNHHPVFEESFASRLAALNIKAVGMDLPGPDHTPYPVHHILLNAGVAIIENMTHLNLLPIEQVFVLIALPLQWPIEASWVRPVAFLPPSE